MAIEATLSGRWAEELGNTILLWEVRNQFCTLRRSTAAPCFEITVWTGTAIAKREAFDCAERAVAFAIDGLRDGQSSSQDLVDSR